MKKKNFFYYIIPSLVKGIVSIFLMVPLMTYYLDPKDFGIAAAIGMISCLITPLSSTGFEWILHSNYYKVSKDERKVLVFNILFFTITLRVIWYLLFAFFIKYSLPLIIKDFSPIYFFYFQLSLIGIMLSGVWPILSSVIVLEKQGKVFALFEFSRNILDVCSIASCLIIFHLSIETFFIASIITGAFTCIMGGVFFRSRITPRLSRKWINEILRVSIPKVPYALLETFTANIKYYFVQRWYSLTQLGIYSHSMRYFFGLNLGQKAFMRTVLPEILLGFQEQKGTDSMERMLNIWYGILAVIGGCIILFSRDIIDIITHGKFIAAADLVPFLFLIVIFNIFGFPYSQYLVTLNKTLFLSVSGILVQLIGVIMGIFLVYNFGIMGAVTAMVLTCLILNGVKIVYARALQCPIIAAKEFIFSMFLIAVLYLLNEEINMNMPLKVIVCLAYCSFVIRKYGLGCYFMAQIRKLQRV